MESAEGYFRVPEMWRKREKLDFLARGDFSWQTLVPDSRNTWLVPEHSGEYEAFVPIQSVFSIKALGLNTNRDETVYDWNRETLANRVRSFIEAYNSEVDRHRRRKDADFPANIKWSSRLKQCLAQGRYAQYDPSKLRRAMYRPFCWKWVFFDSILNQRIGQWPKISGQVLCATGVASEKPFMALICESIADLHLVGAGSGTQCFPLSHLKDSAVAQFRQQYSDESIAKEDVFHYIYALLHHPEYRERYAENLKRELPRIPFAPDFEAFAGAGKELARLHIGYESLEPWPLEYIERRDVPFSEHVIRMKLSKDRTAVQLNDSLSLAGIPPEAFGYRLGSKSAIEWIVDQYQVKGDSDPNRDDDPGYIVRLFGQVVRVSIETARIVKTLPAFR